MDKWNPRVRPPSHQKKLAKEKLEIYGLKADFGVYLPQTVNEL